MPPYTQGPVMFVFLNIVIVCCVQASNGIDVDNFKSKDDHLFSKLDNYELVRPYRSTAEGRFLTHELSTEYEEDREHFHRFRRQAENNRRGEARARDDPGEPEEQQERVFHFSMNAFGRRITLNVTRDTQLVSPSFRVNRYLSDGSIIVEQPRLNCFYRGRVMGSDQSAVAISNCHGISGWIKTNRDEYFIEPLETDDAETTTYNYTSGFVHIMYRRREVRPSSGVTDLHDDVERFGTQQRRHASSYARNVHSRQSRQAEDTTTRRYYVETMVTLDYSMHSFHGSENVSLYILTVMNIVNMIYTHQSLDAHIEFVITRANLLSQEMSETKVLFNDSDSSLRETCRFARSERKVPFDDGSDDHFDHSLFITRTFFGPAGFAPVRNMCDMSFSCSLVKDDGLQSAFVVAHEIGHVFGLEHDGTGNTCYDDAEGMSIMAEVVRSTPAEHYWSECSRRELHRYLPFWRCLLDNPFAGTRPTNDTRPGRPYSMDDQCRFQFGKSYRKCHHTDVDFCRELFCTGPDLHGGCLTKGPPLDGTSCGFERECVAERCVSAVPVDGSWGEWGPYEQCSYSCGVGVQSRQRRCDSPAPDGGGQDCIGSSREYRLCNTQVCPDGPVDKHQEQCDVHGKLREESFLAYQNTDARSICQLSCVSETSGEVYVSDIAMRDGTPASYEYPEFICVGGRPVPIGCDTQLGSTQLWDDCGVCGGQNATCVEIDNQVVDEASKAKKYKKLMILTPGMWNLHVTKNVNSSHFLALKIESSGRYILNRGRLQSPSHAFIESGVRFVYTTARGSETLTARGPIPETLFLMAYVKKDRRPLDYSVQYFEDTSEFTPVTQEGVTSASPVVRPVPVGFTWLDLGWTECNQECGGGYSFHRFHCIRDSDNKRVKYKYCGRDDYNPKGERRPCNEEPCPTEPSVTVYEWQTADWSECSATCGESASRNRLVQCFEVANNVQVPVEPERCAIEGRPHDTEGCNLEPCASTWRKGAWSQCSSTCGPGVKTRDVMCDIPDGAAPMDYACPLLKPPTTKSCEIQRCPDTICTPMDSTLCDRDRFETFCRMPRYSQLCCTTCEELRAQQTGP